MVNSRRGPVKGDGGEGFTNRIGELTRGSLSRLSPFPIDGRRLTFLIASTLESPLPSPGLVPRFTCWFAFFLDPDAAELLAVA